MNRSYALFLIFTVLIGSLAVTHAMTSVNMPDGVTCSSERIASFGWTDKRVVMAEMAAIASWQNETEEKEPGFGNWHQAHKRSMKCREFKNSSHYQCIVSAQPCRYDKS